MKQPDTLTRLLKVLIRLFYGRRIVKTVSESGRPFYFRPAETPGLLRGLAKWELKHLPRLQTLLRPGEVIIDVGAHIGLTAQRFDAVLGGDCRILAIEPNPRNRALLETNTAALPKVSVHALALNQTGGMAEFTDNTRYGALSGLTHSLSSHAATLPGTRVIKVEAMTLDDFVAGQGVAPSFVKIDAEGGAAEILRGATRTLAAHPLSFWISMHGDAEQRGVSEVLSQFPYIPVRHQKDGMWVQIAWMSANFFVHRDHTARIGLVADTTPSEAFP